MDPFEVYAYWDSKENQPHLTLNTMTLNTVVLGKSECTT